LPPEWRETLLRTWGDMAFAYSEKLQNLVGGPYQALKDQGLEPTRIVEWPGATANGSLKINRSELGQLSLETGTGFVTPYKDTTPGLGTTETLATAQSPSVAKPDNAGVNRKLRLQPPFTREVSLHPEPSCPVLRAAAEARKRSG